MPKDTEIEIQVKVEKVKPLLDFLAKNGKFQAENRQIDEYFTPVQRDFLSVRPAKEWLRLRNENSKQSVTYKLFHYDEQGKSTHCDEYETEVKDADQLRKIFMALNVKSLTVVDKLRKTWNYEDYEIAIDSVKNLGDFVEVEYKGKDQNPEPKLITQKIVSFLKEVGCGTILRNFVGYPFQLLFPDEVKFEKQ